MCRQFLLGAVEVLEPVKVLLEFLHEAHVLERLGHVLGGLVLGAAQARDLVVGGPFEIAHHGRGHLPPASGRGTAPGHVARGRIVFGGALPHLPGLLAERVLQVALDIVDRVLPDEMLHAFGMPVELLVQLVLPGEKLVQTGRQFLAFFGVGLGRLLFELLGPYRPVSSGGLSAPANRP